MQLNIYTNILNCVYKENNDALLIGSVELFQTGVQFRFFGISFFVVGVVNLNLPRGWVSLPLATDQIRWILATLWVFKL